ncbi:MAG: hypothetical protein PGN34_14025 [Methylobacterium frigidaeris]
MSAPAPTCPGSNQKRLYRYTCAESDADNHSILTHAAFAARARIAAAYESGECCELVGRAARTRCLEVLDLVKAKRLDPFEAAYVILHAEDLVRRTGPLPTKTVQEEDSDVPF